MGLLSGIKNYIKTEVLGITNDTTVKSAREKEVKEPVIQCENVGKNEDTVTVKNNENQISEDKQMNIGQKRQAIELKCKSNDINITKVIKRLIGNVGLTQEQFDALSVEKKLQILGAVEFAVDRIIAHKNKHGISKQINKEEMVSASALNVYEALKEGDIESIEEFQRDIGDVNEELGKDFQKQDAKSRRKTLEGMAKRHSEQLEQNLNKELKNIPKEKREEYIARKHKYHNRVKRARFYDVVTIHDTETANLAIVTLNANDMAYGAKTVLKTRINQEERTKAADMQTFKFMQDNLKAYYERGEKADAAVIQEYNEVTMSEKSYQAANIYQEDYKEARIRFENGEETPPYMSEEVFTSTAKGIGSGALNNVNMTTEEKAGFLATWENDAKSFSDYEVVTKGVKEEIAKAPEFAEKFEKAKQNVLKNNETSNETKNEEVYKADANMKSAVTIPQTTSDSSTVKSENLKADSLKKQIKQEETAPRVYQPQNATQQEIVTVVKRPSSLDEAFKQYAKKDIIKVVLGTQHLRHLRPQIADRLNNMDVAELEYYADSTENFLFILRNISPQKAAKLYDKKKAIGHDAKILGEEILEKGNNEQNAIA